MSNFKYTVGLNNVGSYQVSGRPFAIDPTSTAITFPYVTSWIKIVNDGVSDRKVGFSANGVAGTEYFLVPATSSTEPLYLKLTELHLDAVTDVTIVAGELDAYDTDVMIVGHLPFLAYRASLFVAGKETANVAAFDAGSIACLSRRDPGRWQIEWMITPEILQ